MVKLLSSELAAVSSLSNTTSVQEALSETLRLSSSTESRLESEIYRAQELVLNHAATLTSATQLATATSQDAADLHSVLTTALRTSTTSCVPLRSLHLQLSNATATLEWAEDILMLRICAEGAKTSLSADDLESAADHVEKYLQLPDAVRADTASASAVSQMEQSRRELARKVRERANDTLEKKGLDTSNVLEAVKLFIPIGEGKEALMRMSQYLGESIASDSREDVRTLIVEANGDGEGADEPHLVVMARLFESVAAILHDVRENITAFGEDAMCILAEALQGECDRSSVKIWERYIEKRGLNEIVASVRSGNSVEGRELDGVLDEVTLLSQRIEAYFAFLKGWDHAEKVVRNCKLLDISHDVAKMYKTVENYFMKANARLAIKIDESNGDDAETSTAVDDFFFVMQKCVTRAFAYGDTKVDVLREILQHISLVLSGDLLAYMKRRLNETETALDKVLGNATGTSALPSAAATVSYLTELAKANISIPGGLDGESQTADVAKYDFFVALNNASTSANYASRLRGNVEKAVLASKNLNDEDRSKLSAPIAQITDASRALGQAAENGVSRLAKVLLGQISVVVDSSLRAASYVVTETQYSLDSDATPSFSREVSGAIENKVLSTSLEGRLSEKNWDGLVRFVAEWYAGKVEAFVFLPQVGSSASGKQFNTFGGLRADRDVRAISAYFSGKSRRSTVRDVFGRLSQLAMIVNLERPAEIYEIWGPNAGGMTWRLTPAEVRQTLILRGDFSQAAINSLKL